jgi:transposase InsO family protein
MGAERKREVIDLVRRSPLPKRHTLEELGIPRSTYFRWQRRFRQQGEVGLVDRRPQPGRMWNRLTPQEEETILREALRGPELSSRELACWVTDHGGFSVSESTVYRLLKRHGLIREVKVLGFPAGKEYHVKTTRINEQWQSDASYFFVVGWGWYYLISVLDDYSRFILAWDLKRDMTAESIGEVVQQAVEWTGMEQVPVEDRTRLLSDRGPGYLARALEDYLRMLETRHIYCSPYHPQTNGKLERFHETLKARLNLLVFTSPEALRAAMGEFIEFYKYRRYHEGVGNVTPADVYFGRREEILKRRKEQKQATLERRFQYNLDPARNQTPGELGTEL